VTPSTTITTTTGASSTKTTKSGSSNTSSTSTKKSKGASGNNRFSPSAWSRGLSKKQQYEWFVDCYRLRLDEEYVYRGDLTGLYNPESGPSEIVQSFLVFCKLALHNNVIPDGWDWSEFLKIASENLNYAFEKSDAQEKYGSENVFAVMTGGRSLRATAEEVYGTPVTSSWDSLSQDSQQIQDEVDNFFEEEGSNFYDASELFADVGGPQIWQKLRASLKKR